MQTSSAPNTPCITLPLVFCTLSVLGTISSATRDPNRLSGPAHHRFGITESYGRISAYSSSLVLSKHHPGWSFEGIPGYLQQVARSRGWPVEFHKCVWYGSTCSQKATIPRWQFTLDNSPAGCVSGLPRVPDHRFGLSSPVSALKPAIIQNSPQPLLTLSFSFL